MNHSRTALLAFAALAANCYAVETRFWIQSEQSDFEKGSRKNVSLRSDGLLTLGPAISEVFDSSTPYLWSAARDSQGNVYAGGGGSEDGSARLFRIGADGKGRKLADLPGIAIQALAVDAQDRIYAATSPEGKVYRVSPTGEATVFFDPKARYIWALAFDRAGDLFVATGDPGKVFRVTPAGASSLYFETDETNARSLALDRDGNLLLGTEPGGLIVRLTPQPGKTQARGFVVYQAAKAEVTALAVAPNGDVYAAASGTRSATPSPAAPQPAVAATVVTQLPQDPAAHLAATAAAPRIPRPAAGGAELYRISPDGSPRRVWSDSDAVIYAIAFDSSGKPLLGTGNRGAIYRVDSSWLSTLVVDLPPTQITAFVPAPGGALYALTGNIGKLYRVGPGLAPTGTFESEAFDAGSFSYWGAVTLDPKPSSVTLETRSGNLDRPEQNWSPWQSVPLDGDTGRSSSPSSRFLQYRLTLRPLASGESPKVSSVTAAYLPKNLPPEVQELEVTPPNYRFPPQSLLINPTTNLTLPPLGGRHAQAAPAPMIDITPAVTMNYAKGFLGVRWTAADPNSDTLVYKVEIRGVHETSWRLLKDKLTEKSLSFDSAAFPDGDYLLRITASDEPSNPPAQALTDNLVSDPFTIDNTPPVIVQKETTRSGSTVLVHCAATDSTSVISKAEFSTDGGEWRMIEPVTRLSDARQEEYMVPVPASGEHVVALRVTDDYDNQTVAKIVVR